MTTQPTTPKRWRPKFSVRTLATLRTLVCGYAACWGPTKKQGVQDLHNAHWEDAEGIYCRATATAPLIVALD